MPALLDTLAAAIRIPDRQGPDAWAASKRLKIPNSAVSDTFDVDAAPWLRDIFAQVQDNQNREVVVLGPTGGGKTTIYDVMIPYIIVEDPGSILLAMQGNDEGREYCDERLNPILDALPDVRALLPTKAHKRTKDTIIFPHMSFFAGGANFTNFQRRSVRWVFLDECHEIDAGLIGEARRRTHDRWNARVTLVSQGGNTGEELDKAWLAGDQAHWSFRCPVCHEMQQFLWQQVKYDVIQRADGALDLTETALTARYACENPACEKVWPDTPESRRVMASLGSYVPSNLMPVAGHVSRHFNALTVYRIAWGELVIEWLEAQEARRRLNFKPLKDFINKRLGEAFDLTRYALGGSLNTVVTGGYTLAECETEEFRKRYPLRFLAWDKQGGVRARRLEGVCRAYGREGSVLVWTGLVDNEIEARKKQEALAVRDAFTFEDCAFEPDDVYAVCRSYGWIALYGSDNDEWTHPADAGHPTPTKRYYKPVEFTKGARRITWSNPSIKDVVLAKRTLQGQKDAAGKLRVDYWGLPTDCSPIYMAQINQRKEVQTDKEGRISEKWPEKGNNHRHDCECMIEVGWQMYKDGLYPNAPKL